MKFQFQNLSFEKEISNCDCALFNVNQKTDAKILPPVSRDFCFCQRVPAKSFDFGDS